MVEIRVPTFRRPALLHRALRSLLAQTHQDWRAVVLDDSTLREGDSVVRTLGDARIVYRPNLHNLGRVRNINRAFRQEPFFSSASHACVLEDDNWYDPTFIEDNLSAIQQAKVPVLVRNYRIVDVQPDRSEVMTGLEPLKEIYGCQARMIPFAERVQECFFSFGLGNLSYFWDLHASLDISMTHELFEVHVAETGRAVSFVDDCWYEPEARASFSRFVCKDHTPSGESNHDQTSTRLARLSQIYFTHRLLHLWTRQVGRTVTDLLQIASQRAEHASLTLRLAETGSLDALLRLRGFSNWVRVAKGLPLVIRYSRLHKRFTRISHKPLLARVDERSWYYLRRNG